MKIASMIFGVAAFITLAIQFIKILVTSEPLTSADSLVLASTFSFLSTFLIGLNVALKD